MEMILNLTKYGIIACIITLLTGCCSNNNNDIVRTDLYNYPPQAIWISGKVEWIDTVLLKKYIKNSAFDTIRSIEYLYRSDSVIHYNSIRNETDLFINKIDYHYDFELELIGDNRREIHRFSDVIIQEFEANPFPFKMFVKYKYNSNWYEYDECDFRLDTQ